MYAPRTGDGEGSEMSVNDNKQLVRRYFDGRWNDN